ncbi:hypothetical protein AMTR_s00083p00176260 [Amborella trichopoda]|uniref:Plant heme peroxidase family profile domain-containing protein n=1 Tax=Amborella trichopoda TaxID=13333 RepID=W1P6D6_AMBTC|nr:hypothetical protein AMTR_s00083p00176260 [Amborella trichopoda]
MVATLVLSAFMVALGEAHKHRSQHHGLHVTFYEHTCPKRKPPPPPNSYALRGLEVLDDAKAQLEAACPCIVSCTDTIALATRDASVLVGIPHYSVPCGHRDSCSSRAIDVLNNLPAPFYDLPTLTHNFEYRNLNVEDFVALSGAHSIVNAHCSSFGYGLYGHSHAYSMDKTYADELKHICPPITLPCFTNPVVKLSKDSTHKMDGSYYSCLRKNQAFLPLDHALMTSSKTRTIMRKMALHPDWWARKFGLAMEKIGTIGILTGGQGEVRSSCRYVNGGE